MEQHSKLADIDNDIEQNIKKNNLIRVTENRKSD